MWANKRKLNLLMNLIKFKLDDCWMAREGKDLEVNIGCNK